jgi:predicted alpha-1,2-mannosidase
MKKNIFCALGFLSFLNTWAQQKTPADYVDPFIGASTNAEAAGIYHGLGKTFPGAATPFGLVQVSPNTITGGDNGSGYSYEMEHIEGFAFTQMSGIGWYGDLGNFLVTPTTGKLHTVAGRFDELPGYRSRYSKTDEVAKPGYYAATLTDYKIRSEATAAPHSGMLRFTFPKHSQSRIQIDLARRVGGTATEQYIKVVDGNTIQGWMKCTPEGGGWGDGEGQADYIVYFYAKFSKPFRNYGVWSADVSDSPSRKRRAVTSLAYDSLINQAAIIRIPKEQKGAHLGFFNEFTTTEGEKVTMKAGISFASMDGAKLNLDTEIPDWDFDRVKNTARKLWNKSLSAIKIEGGTEERKTIFYTALYHTLIDPRAASDVDGSYAGADHKLHKSSRFVRRTIFSGWDVFRSQFPLQSIINPKVVSDMISSLTELAEESGKGYFERWELLNAYTGCMIGNPAIPVIADAYSKGIRNFDMASAYSLSVNTAERFGNGHTGQSMDISTTLEYAFDEWCVAELAKNLNHLQDAKRFTDRSGAYKKIFDSEKGWFRPKNADGSWKPWPVRGRLQQDYGTLESNPYQQGWFVPHDIDGLAKLLGGREKMIADLNSFFEHTPENFTWNDYYNQANEPVHLVPFMFNTGVEGLVGNEDVGQMSAWYVLAASGLHQATPGNPRYELFSPSFDKISIRAGATGKFFTVISTENSPGNVYIQSAKLNGRPYDRCFINHEQLLNGGILELVMGPKPNTKWGLSD